MMSPFLCGVSCLWLSMMERADTQNLGFVIGMCLYNTVASLAISLGAFLFSPPLGVIALVCATTSVHFFPCFVLFFFVSDLFVDIILFVFRMM